MNKKFISEKILLTAILFLFIALIPAFFGFNEYYTFTFSVILVYACASSAWNIIGGMAGQFDLAAASYVGLGMFTSGTLYTRFGIPFWMGMPLGGVVAMGFALLLGYPTFRFKLREFWYALSSIASVPILRILFLVWEDVGGPIERWLGKPNPILMRFDSFLPYFYILVGALAVIIYVNYRIKNSKTGYYLFAIGADEEAAASLGIDVRRYKLKALMIYAFILGMLGAIYVNLLGNYHPDHFDTFFTITIASIGIIGGLGVIYGAPIVAFILVGISEVARFTVGTMGGLPWVIYGLAMLVIVLFRPQGVGPMFKEAYIRAKGLFKRRG
ncbi:MAG: branched-chain amino acid ABC transporter permease [Candidatus Hadarchaeum sp.]|uniref:branched-chain amino acid ABC transporter permease n=1 Tax=Candidatus Hadarchaeum sp. TaxID=2883567 RepID=UPI0031800316